MAKKKSQEFLSQVPLLFMWLLSLRVSAHGAALTEKCRGIPPFVNQMPGDLIDHERQYLVRFVTEPCHQIQEVAWMNWDIDGIKQLKERTSVTSSFLLTSF